jgi:hypothetical protein
MVFYGNLWFNRYLKLKHQSELHALCTFLDIVILRWTLYSQGLFKRIIINYNFDYYVIKEIN